jgi:hypothetical protein
MPIDELMALVRARAGAPYARIGVCSDKILGSGSA